MEPYEWTEDEQRQTAAALRLLQRLPPQDLEANLADFQQLVPHLARSLPPYVNRPLEIKRDPEHNRYFIACEYNQDAGVHRSPWSNKYFPAPQEVEEDNLYRPSGALRELEQVFNDVFDAYKTSYYDGGVSSAYLWDLEEGFAGAFLIHKEASESRGVDRAIWDSVHLVEVRERATSQYTEYKISTTVLLHMEMGEKGKEESELAGHVTRQHETKAGRHKKTAEDMHLLHIGRLIEDMENQVRQSIDHVYMAKQREVVHAVRSMDYADLSSTPSVKQVGESAKDEKERRQRNEKERKARMEAEQEVKRHFQRRAEEEAAEKARQVAQQAAEDAVGTA